MCQILFSESANPPKQALIDGNEMNKDGFGMAWVKDGVVEWNKGFEANQLTDEVIDYYNNLPFPKAIHFRLATHGGTSKQLTHPFPINRGNTHNLTGKAKAVLFHNGVWHAYDDRIRDAILAGSLNPNVLKGGMSDSRAMAILAQRFGIEFLDLLSLGVNKVLILTEKSFVTYGSWTEKEGWSASNSRIFRPIEGGKRESRDSKGVALGPSGLPLTDAERTELGRQGYLNRHGNLRRRFRGWRQLRIGERDVDTTPREVDAQRNGVVSIHDQTDRPTPGSVYLSATMEQIREVERVWGERQVN